MGEIKTYKSNCPSCNVEKIGRKRDIGKLCKKCNMKAVEEKFRFKRIKEDKKTVAEHCSSHRKKYKDDDKFRLNRLLQAAKNRAKTKRIDFDLTLDDLIVIFPKDKVCPALGIPLFWGSNGKGNRDNSPSLDRIDSNSGYAKDNVSIISWRANRLKSDSSIEELESILYYMKS